MKGIMIAATGSGCGKTTVTCALLTELKRRGITVAAFKCGPDYIDPMFHRNVLGLPSYNLDSFLSDADQIRRIYAAGRTEEGLCVVEGVMGLFDGLGGVREEGSSYEIACILELPIILVVDAYGMGRSILPLIAGFLKYDTKKRIRGVLLNRITETLYHRIAPVIEQELGVAVIGFLPKNQELVINSRPLGLQLPGEIRHLQSKLTSAADMLSHTAAIEKILEIARGAGKTKVTREQNFFPERNRKKCVKIGIAMDEAFCFYYEENRKVLEMLGAELIPFSPLHDDKLPEGVRGLLLGGGYPENYAGELEENASMRASIRQAIEAGMPSLAECGGFMYLHETLRDGHGNVYSMCGVVEGECFDTGGLVRFGYVELREKEQNFLEMGKTIKGHEFHYYDSTANGQDCYAKKPLGGRGWECIHSGEHHFWGFAHLYYPSNIGFAAHFIEEAGHAGAICC